MTSRRRLAAAGIPVALVLVAGGAWFLRTPTVTGTWRFERAPDEFFFTVRDDDGRVSGVGVLAMPGQRAAALQLRGLRVGRDVTLTISDPGAGADATFSGRLVRRGVLTGDFRGGSETLRMTFLAGELPATPTAGAATEPAGAARADPRRERLREILRGSAR